MGKAVMFFIECLLGNIDNIVLFYQQIGKQTDVELCSGIDNNITREFNISVQ